MVNDTVTAAGEILEEAGVPAPSFLVQQLKEQQSTLIWGVLRVAAVLLLFLIGRYIINRILRVVRLGMTKKAGLEKGTEQFLLSALRFVLYALLIIMILSGLGIPSASIAAAIASAGVAVGLALQGSLSNLAGGILILYTRPFVVGDYIKTTSAEGFVDNIGLIYTELRQFDNTKICVPNSDMTNDVITNCTARQERRITLDIGISYQSDIDEARRIILETILAHEEIDRTKEPSVAVTELQDSSVSLTAFVWIRNMDYGTQLGLKNTLREEIKKKLDSCGIEIPFPQMDVHIK